MQHSKMLAGEFLRKEIWSHIRNWFPLTKLNKDAASVKTERCQQWKNLLGWEIYVCGAITILIFALLKGKYKESCHLIVTFMILWLGTASHLLHWHGCRTRKWHLPNTVHPSLCCAWFCVHY